MKVRGGSRRITSLAIIGAGLIALLLVAALADGTRGSLPELPAPTASSATTGGASAVPPPAASVDPSPSEAAVPSRECVDPQTYTTSDDGVDPTIANLSPAADEIVVGTILDISDPRWNSPDRSDPGEPRSADQVVRSITIGVDGAREAPDGPEMVVLAPGGTIGCQTFVFPRFPELTRGQQYAMFLTRAGVNDGSKALAIFEIWPVTDGVVDTALDGAVPLDEFLARIGAEPAP